jgi:hypothetical protein
MKIILFIANIYPIEEICKSSYVTDSDASFTV